MSSPVIRGFHCFCLIRIRGQCVMFSSFYFPPYILCFQWSSSYVCFLLLFLIKFIRCQSLRSIDTFVKVFCLIWTHLNTYWTLIVPFVYYLNLFKIKHDLNTLEDAQIYCIGRHNTCLLFFIHSFEIWYGSIMELIGLV